MNVSLLNLDMLAVEMDRYAYEDDEAAESASNTLNFIRKGASSQRELMLLMLELLRMAKPSVPLFDVFSEFIKINFPLNYNSNLQLQVFHKEKKVWLYLIATFTDCYVLSFGEDIIVSSKKEALDYDTYIKKF